MQTTPVMILCGGSGIWIDSSGTRKAKALVEVSGEPLLYWLIKSYVKSGFHRFILSTGYQSELIHSLLTSRYQAKTLPHQAENLYPQAVSYQLNLHGSPCTIDVAHTGYETTTGDRIKKLEPLFGSASSFAVTYSDTLCSVPLNELYQYHQKHQKTATLLATHAPTRFRILGLKPTDSLVRGFAAKPIIRHDRINGGFYFFERSILGPDYLGSGSQIVLEERILEKLAEKSQLMAYPYDGSWCYLDCERDLRKLSEWVQSEL